MYTKSVTELATWLPPSTTYGPWTLKQSGVCLCTFWIVDCLWLLFC